MPFSSQRSQSSTAEVFLGIALLMILGAIILVFLYWQLEPKTGPERKDLFTLFAQVLGGIILLLSLYVAWRHNNAQREMAIERSLDETLQSYFDRITDLMLANETQTNVADTRTLVNSIANARTLTILKGLDGARKGLLLHFLYSAGLIYAEGDEGSQPAIDLREADFSEAQLSGAKFPRASLAGANFTGANLTDTDLTEADLQGATLSDADLTDVLLYLANLTNARLVSANLTYAQLMDADLTDADLTNANLTKTDLTNVDLRAVTVSKQQLAKAARPEDDE